MEGLDLYSYYILEDAQLDGKARSRKCYNHALRANGCTRSIANGSSIIYDRAILALLVLCL